MRFYTSIEKQGDSLLIRAVENGVRKKFKHKPNPILYNTQSKTKVPATWHTLDGKPVYPTECNGIRDSRRYVEEHPDVYGQTNAVSEYISKEYPNTITFNKTNLVIYSIDIETTVEDMGTGNSFPDYRTSAQEILLITVQDNITKKITTFGSRIYNGEHQVDYVLCLNEKDLYYKFISFWQGNHPDIITGWNIEGFDMPYLIKRMQRVLGNETYKKLSPWGVVTEKNIVVMGKEQIVIKISGVAILDYLVLYKKYIFTPRESYKLDHIAHEELRETKLDHSKWDTFYDFYTKAFDKFVDYNRVDVILVDRLEDKLNLLSLHLTISYLGKLNYSDSLSPVKLWDNIIYNYLYEKNIVIPPEQSASKSEKFKGAYVKNPSIGKHKWIASFDLQSLYPHTIMQLNCSPETLQPITIPVTVESLLAKTPYDNMGYSIAANGCCYDKHNMGFLPTLMERIYEDRAKAKKEMIENEKIMELIKDAISNSYYVIESKQYTYNELLDYKHVIENEISRLNNIQMALKIALNSLYGALGNAHFRYYDLRLAVSITTTSQLAIRWVTNKLNAFLNQSLKTNVDYAIMNDTDSVYLTLDRIVESTQQGKTIEQKIEFMDKFCNKVLSPVIKKSYEELAVYLNSYQNKMSMKREILADVGIVRKKKNYIMRVYNSEGVRYTTPKLKIMGLEMIKTSTPSIIRDKLKSTIDIMLDGSNADLVSFVETIRSEFYELPIEEIAFPKSVNGVEKYTDTQTIFKKGCPIQVRAAILHNNMIDELKIKNKYQKISSGDKIKFIYLKKPNTIMQDVIGFHGTLPSEFNLMQYVDKEKQFEKVFLTALENTIAPMGWSLSTGSTLDDFFC